MSEPSTTPHAWQALFNPWIDGAIALAPRALVILTLLVAGALLARVLDRLTARLIDRSGLEAWAERLGVSRLLYSVGIQMGLARLGGRLMRWLVWLLTLQLILAKAGLPSLSDGLHAALHYVPTLLSGALILAIGAWGADALRQLVRGDTQAAGAPTRALLASLTYYVALAIVITLALEQIGMEVTLILLLMQATLLAAVLATGVTFALSARASFEQLTARYYARALLRVGDQVTLDDGTTGHLERFDMLHLVLRDANRDELLVPYRRAMSAPLRFRKPDDAHAPAPPSP